MVSSMSLANIVPVMRAVLLPLFRLSTRDLLIRLIGCQPIKAQIFRIEEPSKKRENSYPQLYTTRAVISLPYIFVLVFTCFLYAVPCCIEHIYRPSFVYFLFSMTTSFGLYGVLSSYKYQSWVGACDIRRDPFPCVIVPHQFKIALEAGVA